MKKKNNLKMEECRFQVTFMKNSIMFSDILSDN